LPRLGALGIVIVLVIGDLAAHSIVRPALWVTTTVALLAASTAVIAHLKGRDAEVNRLFALASYRALWTVLLALSYAAPVFGDMDDPALICLSMLLGFSMVQDGIVFKGDSLAGRIKTFFPKAWSSQKLEYLGFHICLPDVYRSGVALRIGRIRHGEAAAHMAHLQ
jgi:hypothetical protein